MGHPGPEAFQLDIESIHYGDRRGLDAVFNQVDQLSLDVEAESLLELPPDRAIVYYQLNVIGLLSVDIDIFQFQDDRDKERVDILGYRPIDLDWLLDQFNGAVPDRGIFQVPIDVRMYRPLPGRHIS